MSISQTLCTSFKAELYEAVHNLLTDTIQIALYTDNATLDESTTVYTTTSEISGAGYTAGGIVLTGATINTSGQIAYVDFADAVWTGALTARGALIYNASKSNKAIAVLDFGTDKTSVITFTVTMPANTPTSALIRS